MALTEVQMEDRRYAAGLTEEEIADMVMDSVLEAADGCSVEPDGECPHGHRSPLLVMGMI